MNESKRGGTLIFTLGLLLLLIFSPTLSYSKEDWQKVSGPWDQKFESSFGKIAVDPTNSNIIYLANEGGAGIYKSVDGGVSWHTANKGIPKLNSTRNYFPISGIFVNPHKPTTIYSSTATPFSADPWDPIARGIFKSKTGGNSWKKSNGKSGQASLPKGEGGGVLSIFRLVGDPNHPDTLYTGHAIAGIYKTADGGSTWLERNNGLPNDPIFGLHVNVLEVDPSNTNTLYAAPYIHYSVSYLRDKGPQPQGIYKTVDGGDNWARLDTGSIILPLPWDLATFVTSLKVSPHDSNTIYFGTSDKGIYKSTDGGSRWVEVNGTGDNKIPQDAMGYYQINCLIIDPIIPNRIYAGLNNGGVYKSIDGGANWSSYNNGLDAGIDVNYLSFVSDRLYATTSKGVYVTDMLPRLQGDEASFYGGLLKEVVSGLVCAATGEKGCIVSESMGLILKLLGWGDSNNSGDVKLLKDMSAKLDQIVNLLNDIQDTLKKLLGQLIITEGEIIANTNSPNDAIDKINSSHKELRGWSKGTPGSVNQPTMMDTQTGPIPRIEGSVYDIYNQVDNINYAILPLTPETTWPILNNFTKLSIDKGNSLTDTYPVLEQYFSKLLYYQMMGVNLIVETKIYREKAKLSQIGNQNAQTYLTDSDTGFIPTMLKPEVDNFMNNVYRMILSKVNLVDTANFLPSEAQGILSRANFFRIQTLNLDHFGLRGTLIATQDLVSSVMTVKARNKQTGHIYPGTGTLYTVSRTGFSYDVQVKTYDYWNGNNVKPSSDYTVIEYDFGDAPLGDYDILERQVLWATGTYGHPGATYKMQDDGNFVISDRNGLPLWASGTYGHPGAYYVMQDDGNFVILDASDNVIGSATVQTFKDDYTVPQDGSGTINYGHFLLQRRYGAKDAFNRNPIWTWKVEPLKNAGADGSSDIRTRYVSLRGKSDGDDEYYGGAELKANFVYTGPANKGFTITYSAHAYGTAQTSLFFSFTSTIRYKISIWDNTTNQGVLPFRDRSETSEQSSTKRIDEHPQGSWYFPNPSPGHEYSIVFYCHIDGSSSFWGSAEGDMTIDSIAGNVFITF